MTVSLISLDNLDFVWDPEAEKHLQSKPALLQDSIKKRDFQAYLDFLEDIAPAINTKKDSILTRDLVFEL